MNSTVPVKRGFTAEIVRVFITSKLSLLLLIASLLAGMAALLLTPREEEPQIVVPMADVFVHMPGASAEEVEKLAASPLEAKLREVGDEEAQMTDWEFVEALEYGMPPTFGFGFSERLFSFLMNKPARDCQIFPLLKPKK